MAFLPEWCCGSYCVIGGIGGFVGLYFLMRYILIDGTKCPSKARIDGKTVIITGGNTGIGKTTAILLAERGGRIILACRNADKANAAVADIKKKSGSNQVIFKSLNLASTASIREFADDILKTEDRIDILLLNAGVMIPPYQETEDGFELQFGVNHLGHFLLTYLLLDRIKASAPSRVVAVSSVVHRFGNLDFDDMMWKKRYLFLYTCFIATRLTRVWNYCMVCSYNRLQAYGRSKLANVMFARELGKRVAGSGVTYDLCLCACYLILYWKK